MRKPQPGRCGVCGTAVVMPTVVEVLRMADAWRESARLWVSGHCYEADDRDRQWRLRMVRCERHVDESDPRYRVEMITA